jgi:hypothetical protein
VKKERTDARKKKEGKKRIDLKRENQHRSG